MEKGKRPGCRKGRAVQVNRDSACLFSYPGEASIMATRKTAAEKAGTVEIMDNPEYQRKAARLAFILGFESIDSIQNVLNIHNVSIDHQISRMREPSLPESIPEQKMAVVEAGAHFILSVC
jgi:hypothetical protein